MSSNATSGTAVSLLLHHHHFHSKLFCPPQICKQNSKFPSLTNFKRFLYPSHFTAAASRRGREHLNGAYEFEEEEEEEEYGDDDVVEEEKDDDNDWLRNKPRGFGEGRVYDTSLEEKILEEIEQSRKAQLANVNKLKNQNVKNKIIIDQDKLENKKESDGPTGIRVRVSNLPKKKNIHKDLQTAFKGFPGIINIIPAVTGNRKTRDPICKGFAFIDLETEEIAERFVMMYSNQSVIFGKVEKEITCSMVSRDCMQKPSLQHHDSSQRVAQEMLFEEDNTVANSCADDLPSNQEVQTSSTGSMVDADLGNGATSFREANEFCPGILESNDCSAISEKKKNKTNARKKKVIVKSQKAVKQSLPASMGRLKVRERAALTGVLTKYGGKNSAASSNYG